MKMTDVAVVGGGPAGLSAAIAAGRGGARTVLLDENRTLGGQLRYRLTEVVRGTGGQSLRPMALAAKLLADAEDAGVDVRPSSLAWGLFEGKVIAVTGLTDSYHLRAEAVVIATGSTDLPFPFVGGSLPGVFSARAVQLLLHKHRVLPGRRFVVLGGGSEAVEVAADIRLAGGDVVAVFDPIDNHDAVVAEGRDGIRTVTLGGTRYDADILVIAVGRQPDAALAFMAGCAGGYAASLGGFVPARSDALCTSVDGIVIAGDAAGICDVAVALAEGRLAGTSAAAQVTRGAGRDLEGIREPYAALARERIAATAALQPVFAQE
ncbi:MAG: NAD(P)/FAD-dependent oxidoreductase [Chloroflexota bacterium]|nr:NAD(P)/FAD-dependent oxidoreductase [Chloroflexota bacterium]